MAVVVAILENKTAVVLAVAIWELMILKRTTMLVKSVADSALVKSVDLAVSALSIRQEEHRIAISLRHQSTQSGRKLAVVIVHPQKARILAVILQFP